MTSPFVVNLREVDFSRRPEHDELGLVYRQVVALLRGSVRYWRDNETRIEDGPLLRDTSRNYGGFVRIVRGADPLVNLDMTNPDTLFDFTFGEGDDEAEVKRYQANALRKLLWMLMVQAEFGSFVNDSLVLKEAGVGATDPIKDGDDTEEVLPWRPFPWGGCVVRDNGLVGGDKITVCVGISAFLQEEDHWLAELIAKYVLLLFKLRAKAVDG